MQAVSCVCLMVSGMASGEVHLDTVDHRKPTKSMSGLPLRRRSSSPDTMCVIKQDTLSSEIRVQLTNLGTLPKVALSYDLPPSQVLWEKVDSVGC